MSGAMCSSTALNGTMYLGDLNCHIFSEKFLRGYALYARPPVSPGVPLRDYLGDICTNMHMFLVLQVCHTH